MGLFDWLRPPPPPDAPTRARVERAVAVVDPLLGSGADVERKLAPAVRHAIDYCDGIAARIPGPFEISRAAFAADPLVHALFGSADDVDQMLGRSQCVREHLAGPDLRMPGQCCALLGMRRHEKAGFGVRLAGEIIRHDEPQKTLSFSDHTLAEPSPDLPAARARLREAMFDGLLKSFAAHLAEVRAEHDGLHQAQALERARLRASGPEAHTRRLAELEARLRATVDALTPARLIETLADCLMRPEPYLSLEPVTLAVDSVGIIREPAAAETARGTLRFAELSSRDLRRWVVILAHIDRAEALRAVERVNEARRYIVI